MYTGNGAHKREILIDVDRRMVVGIDRIACRWCSMMVVGNMSNILELSAAAGTRAPLVIEGLAYFWDGIVPNRIDCQAFSRGM